MRTWLMLLIAAAILIASCDARLGRRKGKQQRSGKLKSKENYAEIKKHCKMLGGDGIMPKADSRNAATKEDLEEAFIQNDEEAVPATQKPTKSRHSRRKNKKRKSGRATSRRTEGGNRKPSRRNRRKKKKSSRWD